MKVAMMIFVGIAFSATAWGMAGPPLATDDPETPGNNNWEINLAVTSESNVMESRFEAPLADINYGLGEHIQLKYEVPWVISTQGEEASKSGFDRSVGGVKWRFMDENASGISMSTYPQLSFSNPISDDLKNQDPETGNQRDFVIPIEIEERVHRFSFNQELGIRLEEKRQNQWTYGISVGYLIREGFNLLAEIHGKTVADFTGDQLIFNVGGQLDLTKHLGLLVSIGRTLDDFDGDPVKLLAYFGMQVHL